MIGIVTTGNEGLDSINPNLFREMVHRYRLESDGQVSFLSQAEVGADCNDAPDRLQFCLQHRCLALLKSSLAERPHTCVNVSIGFESTVHSNDHFERSLQSMNVVKLPYPTFDKSNSPAPPIEKIKAKVPLLNKPTPSDDLTSEAKRKADKLAAMALRVELLQQQKKAPRE